MVDVPESIVNSHRPQAFGYDEYAQGTRNQYWPNYHVNGKTFSAKDVNYVRYESGAHKDKFRLQLQTELAKTFLNRHVDGPEPFFLYLGYYGPHSPLDAPASLTDQVLLVQEWKAKGGSRDDHLCFPFLSAFMPIGLSNVIPSISL